jgi:hypothetical protein
VLDVDSPALLRPVLEGGLSIIDLDSLDTDQAKDVLSQTIA